MQELLSLKTTKNLYHQFANCALIVRQSYPRLVRIDSEGNEKCTTICLSDKKHQSFKMYQSMLVSRDLTSLRQRATDSMRAAILEGIFAPGQKLSERGLCESLGVSRSCVRESLQHLQSEGLITVIPHKGPEVATINPKEVRDIYAVRAQLEGLAAKGFTKNAHPAQIQALRSKLKELAMPEIAENKTLLLNVKNEFYNILIEGCGNTVVGLMLRQLNNRVTLLRRISLSQPGRLLDTLKELEDVVAAIEKGDGKTAARLCIEHVEKAASNVLKSMSV